MRVFNQRSIRNRTQAARRQLLVERLEKRDLMAVLPTGFTETVIVAEQPFPLSEIQIDQTGRVWFGMVNGDIGVIENDVLLTSNAYSLAARSGGDQGILGMLLDRDFATNGFLYVYYTANDANPNNKLVRLQVNLSTRNSIVAGSEVVILDLPNLASIGDPTDHMGGSLRQFPDGTLLLGVGDHQIAAAAQNLNEPYGKLLRLNPNGTPATNNPYYNASNGVSWTDYIWAVGLRNPYSGDVDPVTGRYFVSDVGSFQFEEVNDATSPGRNFGWPLAEGPVNNILYNDPIHSYSHDGTVCAITAGAFYSGISQQFPIEYQGRYFYSELCGGKIVSVDQNDPSQVQDFATDLTLPLKIEFAPNGSMYYLDIASQSIRKIQYTMNAAPDITAQPSAFLASAGDNATFQVAVAGSAPFRYQWQRNVGSGFADIPGATNATLTLNAVSLGMNGDQYRAIVTNDFGSDISSPAALSVTLDTPPLLSIALTSPRPSYRAGDTISFVGVANDAQDGILPSSSMTWKIDFHHNDHFHSFMAATSGVNSGTFTIPQGGELAPDVWYRVYLTATDSAGFTRSTFKEIFPELSDFSVETTVPGSSLLLNSQALESPVSATGVVGKLRSIEVQASTPWLQGEAIFVEWLDGSPDRIRTIATPVDDTAYVALYGYTDANLELTDLSSLSPIGTPINGWGPIEIDRSNGGTALGDGDVININGTTYTKGFGVHANSDIRFALNRNFNRFTTNVGFQSTTGPLGNVIARVYGDGLLLYDSGLISNAEARAISLGVTGVNELRLVVDSNGSANFDNVVWANPQLAKVVPATYSDKVYLSDLSPVGAPINGWGPFERDMSVGGQAARDGGTINLNGVLFDKGLGVHADSDIRYRLDGQFERFRSGIGLHATNHPGEVIFRVYGDDVLLYDSGVITTTNPGAVDLDVSAVNTLRLVVNSNGLKDFDSAVWADAHLIRNSASLEPPTTYLSDLDPSASPINGWGPYERDMSVGGTSPGDGGTILVNGVSYTKGLGVHSNSDIRFFLGGQYDRFFSVAGLHAMDHAGNVIFRVYGDGALLYESGAVTTANPQSLDLSVAGVEELRLVVDSDGTINFDSAVWADARLTPRPASRSTTTYLSDIDPSVPPTNGWGPYERDMSVGSTAPGDGGTIQVGGVLYPKGLGVHSNSDIRFSLDGQYDRFQAIAGLHAMDHAGNVIFRVYGDGVLLYESASVTIANPQSLDLNIAGVDELRLVVDSNGSINFDSAVWADARVITTGTTPQSTISGVVGSEVVIDGIPVRLLPFVSADATLDSRLTIDDATAVANNLGPRPIVASYRDWIRSGDFDLNGVTDLLDWDILNAAWSRTFGTTLNIADFQASSQLTLNVASTSPNVAVNSIETQSANWHNAALPTDVNGDGFVSPLDALIVINQLRKIGSNTSLSSNGESTNVAKMNVDTDGDGFLSPSDVLRVINDLNRRSQAPEGESGPPTAFSEIDDSLLSQLAIDQVSSLENHKRRHHRSLPR